MKKNTKLFALAGVAALTVVGGTFAYYTSTQTFENKLDTTTFGSSATENFNVGSEWIPGVKVDKNVYATNTGDGKIWARVSFNEFWKRNNEEFQARSSVKQDENGKNIKNEKFFTTDANNGYQESATDGYTEKDENEGREGDTGSVVYKNLTDKATVDWIDGGDGYFYYKYALAKGESTSTLLDGITLCGDTDLGVEKEFDAYIIIDKLGTKAPNYLEDANADKEGVQYIDGNEKQVDWITVDANHPLPTPEYAKTEAGKAALDGKLVYTFKKNEVDPKKPGYSNANYQLDITVDFVQADEDNEAIKASWNLDDAKLTELGLSYKTKDEANKTNG